MSPVSLQMVDLGFAPPSNAYLSEESLNEPEVYLPLRVKVCTSCWLVQTEDFVERDSLFRPDYAYFSGASQSWNVHARTYFEMISAELCLGPDSFVVELASNDGYLLKHFVEAGIPSLGVEPTLEVALQAESLGVRTLREFFGLELAERVSEDHGKADLIIANNVYAHVPDINDFTRGIKELLAPNGTVTLEFPHLLRLISDCQFDTIYHEHYSYLGLGTVIRIFRSAGLRVLRVEKLDTHGGSLRVYGCHPEDPRDSDESISLLVDEEEAFGLEATSTYESFEKRAIKLRNDFTKFLIERHERGQVVVGYGAAAKGNTLLNFAGLKKDLLPVVFDAAPSKQGKFLPGTHIAIQEPSRIEAVGPDVVLVLAWNLAHEIVGVLESLITPDAEIWVALPELKRLPRSRANF